AAGCAPNSLIPRVHAAAISIKPDVIRVEVENRSRVIVPESAKDR
ncbi:MAG: hypothetical protein JWM99_2967, partial [Verrucomicrobiales bacterium]|nr:hypothetical protein [Verrucomicrobiales bacterium]